MHRKTLRRITAATTSVGLAAVLTGSVIVADVHSSASSEDSSAPQAGEVTLASLQLDLPDGVNNRRLERLAHRDQRPTSARHGRARGGAARSADGRPTGSPQQIARTLVLRRGWDEDQWVCLDDLWERESGWDVHAENAGSGAYGIPQALPGWKMASAGGDWEDDAVTQITWGLDYIAADYGDPCEALEHSEYDGYY